jgi:DNA-binding transcriptional ArsR family regulator
MLNLLRDRELSVGELSKLAGIRQSSVSQHLAILRLQGIVKTRREGVTIFYSIANRKIIQAFDIVTEILLERLSGTEKLPGSVHRRPFFTEWGSNAVWAGREGAYETDSMLALGNVWTTQPERVIIATRKKRSREGRVSHDRVLVERSEGKGRSRYSGHGIGP